MSQLLEEVSDVYGFGPPIRFVRYRFRNSNEAGFGTKSGNELVSNYALACWDQLFVMYEDRGGGLVRSDPAAKYISRVTGFCKDHSRLFIGDSVIRGSLRRITFEGRATNQRLRVLEELLVRAFGYDGLFPEIKYYRNADPEIYLSDAYLGRLSEIIRKYQVM